MSLKSLIIALAFLWASPGVAAVSPRQSLTNAAFFTADRTAALAQIRTAEAASAETLARQPANREAQMTRALAVSYRAKLTRSRTEALRARGLFEALVATDPRDPEGQAALGGWHVEGLATLGSMVARMAIGARRSVGIAALDRAVALGGNRAMFCGLSALLRAELDPADPTARSLAETALRAAAPTPIDRIMQQAAGELLATMSTGNRAAVQAKAQLLLPFGKIIG